MEREKTGKISLAATFSDIGLALWAVLGQSWKGLLSRA